MCGIVDQRSLIQVPLDYTYRKEVLRLPNTIEVSPAERQRTELLIDRLEQRLGRCKPVHRRTIVRRMRSVEHPDEPDLRGTCGASTTLA